MNHQDLESQLIERYKKTFDKEGCPDWAVVNKKTNRCIPPSIPFIGKQFLFQEKKILVYASAENLTYYEESKEDNRLLETEEAWNRRRFIFERSKSDFFPIVHMEPINNGGLLAALAVLSEKKSWSNPPSSPFQFIENLSVDNLCKFSISSNGRNMDYIGKWEKVSKSFNYLASDLEILKPDIIFLPKRAYQYREIKEMIHHFCDKPIVIPSYQLTATVVNCHIARQVKSEDILELKSQIPAYLKQWIDKIRINGLREDGILFYLVHCLRNVE